MANINKTELLELVKAGYTDKEIAEMLHYSRSTIQRIRKQFGISRYITIYNKEMYLRMKELNLTDDQVAFVYGSSRRDLNKWKCKVGLSKKRKGPSKLSSSEV